MCLRVEWPLRHCAALGLDELFVLIPRRPARISCASPPPSPPRLFISLMAAFLSTLLKLDTLLAPDSPTTSARRRCRRRSHRRRRCCRRLLSPPTTLPPNLILSSLWLLSRSQVHVSIMWGCYVSAHSWKLLLSAVHSSFFFIGLPITPACSLPPLGQFGSSPLTSGILVFIFLFFFFFSQTNLSPSGVTVSLYTEAICSDCFSCRQMQAPFSYHPVFLCSY